MKVCPECGLEPEIKKMPWGTYEASCSYRYDDLGNAKCWKWATFGGTDFQHAQELWDNKLATWSDYQI